MKPSRKISEFTVIFHDLLASVDFFQKLTFSIKDSFRKPIRVAMNSLDLDQHYVSPYLGQNCLQRLSADSESPN